MVAYLGLLFVVGGGVLLIRGRRFWRAYSASKTWPRVEGRVLTSRVERRVVLSTDDSMAGLATRVTHEPTVTYTYVVHGGQHKGTAVVGSMRKKKAQKWVQSNPSGIGIAVAYDPAHPEHSALPGNLEGKWRAIGTLVVGTLLFLCGTLLIVAGLL